MWSKMRTKRERLALLSKDEGLDNTAWLFRCFSGDQVFCSLHWCVRNGAFSGSSWTNRSAQAPFVCGCQTAVFVYIRDSLRSWQQFRMVGLCLFHVRVFLPVAPFLKHYKPIL